MSFAVNKLKSRVDETFWKILQETDAMISGGALTSIYTNAPINDLDIYFKSASHFTRFIEAIYETDFTIETNFPSIGQSKIVTVHGTTPKSLLMQQSVGAENQMIQAIVYHFFETPEELFKAFDFTINMAALEVKTGKLTFHENFMVHNAQRHLSFNPGTLYPIISLLRVKKYEERGYKISKAQMLRIALTCMQLDLKSWEEVRNHCGGMYGLKLTEVFDETKEFNLQEVVEQLGGLQFDTLPTYSPETLGVINGNDVYNAFKDIIKVTIPEGKIVIDPTRIFKNVVLEQGQANPDYPGQPTWQSIHSSKFKYAMGAVVNGGPTALYGYYGMDVKHGMYFNYGGNGWVLELAPVYGLPTVRGEDPNPSVTVHDHDCKVKMYGNWKVINAWPAKTFAAMFTGTTKNSKPEENTSGLFPNIPI